ncbi:NAD-dependent epimerase/dehydratase family protein [Cloacibacillus sp. An23]|uniref:NAD-dependent epimerase/dehydratase family protein n=1 Tax=Cloacibacillus sp. An23 TaxID=1965591 RepID=UPI000B36F2C2|nr:NAD-dependent epimerase/dehydratase family protein [Cloacibacillus sp. An23]OUO90976.1 hypothetical protein B5F39_13640 [Cloacibacillus sp. An23]
MDKAILESSNPILQEDLENIVERSMPALEQMNGSTVLVTGATGLIGSLAVQALACANRVKKTNINILAFVRDEAKAEHVLGHIIHRPDVKLIIGNVNEKITIGQKVDFIIHGANPTDSKYFVTHPVETIKTILTGTESILELALQKKIKSMVYLSSMEVYGQFPNEVKNVTEDKLGYIDILDIRSSYSEGKRMAECMCASYAAEYGVHVKIARISRIIGPGIVDKNDNRILTQFARCVAEHRDIVLHSTGETLLNYCYTADALAAIFTLMVKGKDGEAYNVTNDKDVLSVKELAETLAGKYSDSGIKVIYDIPDDASKYGYNKISTHILSNNKVEALDYIFEINLANTFKRLIESFELGASFHR